MGSISISMMKVLIPILCLLLITSIVPTRTEAAVSCNTVVANLYPCVSYVVQGGSLTTSCCNGIRTLNGQAKNAADRQSVCRCIKSAVGGVSTTPTSLKNAASLPKKCGVNLPYKIEPSTNCDSIK